LGLERRRKSEGAPKWSVFAEVFAIFGAVFAKSDSFFAKIERNRAVFDSFEKDPLVFALVCETLQFGSKNKDLRRKCGTKNKDLQLKKTAGFRLPATGLRC